MFDNASGPLRQQTTEPHGAWFNQSQRDTGPDATSVPQDPPTRNPSPRKLGEGSIAGTLCATPEIKFTDRGKAFVKVRLAVSRRVKDETSGAWVDTPTEYTDITVWGQMAEHCAENLDRGDRILAIGVWQEETWYGRDEQWHTKRTMSAREIGPSLLFKPVRVIRTKEGS